MNDSTPHLTSAGLCIGSLPPRRDMRVTDTPAVSQGEDEAGKGRVPFAKPEYSVPLMRKPELSEIDDGLALGS